MTQYLHSVVKRISIDRARYHLLNTIRPPNCVRGRRLLAWQLQNASSVLGRQKLKFYMRYLFYVTK